MNSNPLLQMRDLGQSVWMDYIRRQTLDTGQLKRWIDEDGLAGVTSNPSIFEKAIGESHDYDEEIKTLARQGLAAGDIFERIAVEDIQRATDLFRPLYDRLDGADGFVSIEVSPQLAHDTARTIDEARRLWSEVKRPNVMIKVPATKEGLPAIRQLISEGVNVNITLLFGLPRYREVIDAYLGGLEAHAAAGQPLHRVASVASFFLSRIDVLLDPQLEKKAQSDGKQGLARSLVGQVAIASAKVAYRIFQEISAGERFTRLASQGARPQRLLWASTSTKNPAYSDVKYVDALIGPETINTVPVETFDAFRDHGHPAPRLTQDVDGARRVLDSLSDVGIDLDATTQQLEDEGVEKFDKAFDKLIHAVEEKRAAHAVRP